MKKIDRENPRVIVKSRMNQIVDEIRPIVDSKKSFKMLTRSREFKQSVKGLYSDVERVFALLFADLLYRKGFNNSDKKIKSRVAYRVRDYERDLEQYKDYII